MLISFSSWLGNPWSLFMLVSSIFGILLTLYVLTFLLIKSCEGALRKSNQTLASCHLVSIMITFLGSSLFVLHPSPFICVLKTTVHNVSLSSLFGALLVRAMYIHAQKTIGLGGRSSRLNQLLTFCFIVGIQLALEKQRWNFVSEKTSWNFQAFKFVKPCLSENFPVTQIYLAVILLLLLMVAFSARRTPFNQAEGSQTFFVALCLALIFLITVLLHISVKDPKLQDFIVGISMIIQALIVLIGIFIPLLVIIHKYDIFVPSRKSASYTESMSTIFTNYHRESDKASLNSNSSEHSLRNKPALPKKIANTNFFIRPARNHTFHYSNLFSNPYHNNLNHFGGLSTNTLYDGMPGFRSAYP